MQISKMSHHLALLALLTGSITAEAQLVRETSSEVPETAELIVPLYKSRVLTSAVPVERVSVGNPDVADLLILRDRELYVLGKDLGTTNVLLWDRGDSLIGSVAVEVTHDLEGLKEKIFELMPEENINIYAAQRSIVLAGTVSSVTSMGAALQIAQGYLAPVAPAVDALAFEPNQQSRGSSGEVINLLQVAGAQQVMLEVKVAEISRTELRRLGMELDAFSTGLSSRFNFGGVNGGATIVGGEFLPNSLSINDTGFFAGLLTTNSTVNLTLDAAREKGLAKILAEPTLTTLSGQEAEFLSGGEFPIPVPQGNNNGITIEFKEFGVGLRFVPAVLNANQINLKLNVSVSELTDISNILVSNDDSSSSFLVPSLSKRSASATVELLDGQTMAIAGLINEDLREVVNKFPGLGSIPVLGNLFRSQEFIKGESELVILVTPHLARPLPKDQIRLPTDYFIEPTDKEFYLLGRLEGKPREGAAGEGGVESDFGHEID